MKERGSWGIPRLYLFGSVCCAWVCCVGAAVIKLYLYGVSQLTGWEVCVRGFECCVRASHQVGGLAAQACALQSFLVMGLKLVCWLQEGDASGTVDRSAVTEPCNPSCCPIQPCWEWWHSAGTMVSRVAPAFPVWTGSCWWRGAIPMLRNRGFSALSHCRHCCSSQLVLVQSGFLPRSVTSRPPSQLMLATR